MIGSGGEERRINREASQGLRAVEDFLQHQTSASTNVIGDTRTDPGLIGRWLDDAWKERPVDQLVL